MKTKMPKLEDLERVLEDEGTLSERWIWKIRGTYLKHHPTQPAIQWKNGSWSWYWFNTVHRWDGPAAYGVLKKYTYYIHGEQLTHEQWENHPVRLERFRRRIESI